MTARIYPRKVWVLQPSFKPVEVTVVKSAYSYMSTDYGDESDKGKSYPLSEMHESLEAAIAHGRKEVDRLKADIEKRTANMHKKISALDKASGGVK